VRRPRFAFVVLLVAAAAAAAREASGTLTRSASCPATLPMRVLSTRPGAATTLVPPGTVAVLLCTYYNGPNPRSGTHPFLYPASEFNQLHRERLVSERSKLTLLASEFDALRAMHGTTVCPADTGGAELAIFTYRRAPDDPIMVGLSGCEIVSNGHAARSAAFPPDGPALVDHLAMLLS
jgi:hypothetical protein